MNAPDKSLVIWPAVVVDCAAVCTVLPLFSASAAGSGSEANSIQMGWVPSLNLSRSITRYRQLLL
jgi:hypothetical protein